MTQMGQLVEFVPRDGQGNSFNAIFDSEFSTLDEFGNVILSSKPMLQAKESDFDFSPREGDFFFINSIKYKVTEVQEDGRGAIKFLLQDYS